MTGSHYSVYLVRCADDTLYTGIALDVARRFREHQDGARGARYLRGRQPLSLVFSQRVGDRSTASRVEYRLKSLAKADKEALVAGSVSLEALLPDSLANCGQASGTADV